MLPPLLLLLLYFGSFVAPIPAELITEKSPNNLQCNYKEVNFMLLSASMAGRTKRIFLLGDPMLGEMCRDTNFCNRTEDNSSAYTVKMQPNFSTPSNWSHFNMHQLNGAPQTAVYHLSQIKSHIFVMEKELFWGFRPRTADILIILFGAQLRREKAPEAFVNKAYHRIAMKFQGRVFWLEPFPVHFKAAGLGCFVLTKGSNSSQFWKVDIVRRVVKNTDRIQLIRSYDILAPMDRCHKIAQKNGNRDCGRYNSIAYSHVWQAVSLAMLNA